MDVEVGVGSDEEHSLMDSPVSCAVVQGGRCVVQCNIWNEVVGGMKLSELSSFPPNLLSNPTTLYHPVCLREDLSWGQPGVSGMGVHRQCCQKQRFLEKEKSWRSWMECQGVAAGRGWSQSTRKSRMGS